MCIYETSFRSSHVNRDPAIASVFKLAPDVASLLKEFPAAWEPRQPGQLPAHKMEHVIETEGQPLFAQDWIKQS